MLMMVPLSVLPHDEKHVMTSWDITDACDIIDAMIKQEKASYRCKDYMARNKGNLRFVRSAVDEKFRSAMCRWCYAVARIHNYQRETVVEAFSYLDRYLSTNQGRTALVHRDIYQLAAMTALYIAIKINEELVISIEELLNLSSGTYYQSNVERMETRMLDALEWNLNLPTPFSFIQSFSALIPEVTDSTVVGYARHEVELAVSKYNFVKYKPSEIAFAALVKAVLNTDNEILPLKNKKEHICCIKRVCGLFIDVDQDANGCLRFLLEEVSHPCQQEDDASDANSEVSTNADAPGSSVEDDLDTDFCNVASPHENNFGIYENDGSSLASSDKICLQIDGRFGFGPSTHQPCEGISLAIVTNEMMKSLELETKATLHPENDLRNCSHALSA